MILHKSYKLLQVYGGRIFRKWKVKQICVADTAYNNLVQTFEAGLRVSHNIYAQRKSFQPAFDLRFQLIPVVEFLVGSFLTLTPFLNENCEISVEVYNYSNTSIIPGLSLRRCCFQLPSQVQDACRHPQY